ncbi:MAG: efflux transporter outer membrane subunit [Planctomycetota bacterium]
MRLARSSATILPLAVLGSCISFVEDTERDSGLEVPERFAATAEDVEVVPPNERWWMDFGSEGMAYAVETALANNRELLAATAARDAAVARAVIAGADLWPSLDGAFNAARQRQVFVGFPIPGTTGPATTTFNSFTASLSLAWELDLWGRLRAGELAANRDVEVAVAELQALRLSIAARTAQTWLEANEARLQLRIAEDTAQTLRTTESLVDRRFRSGVRPALDLRLTRSDLESAEALVVQRRRELDRVLRNLQVQLGQYPDANVAFAEPLPTLSAETPSVIPGEVLLRRPDLLAADRRLAATDARLGEARAARLPRLSLTGTIGTTSNQIEDLVDSDFGIWSLAGNLTQPIFDAGRLAAQVDLRDAERLQAYGDWARAVLLAFQEIETATAAESFWEDELRRRQRASDEASSARTLSADRYSKGLVDIVTVLDAERRELETRTNALRARRQLLSNRIDLILALGGGLPEATDEENGTDEAETP